MPSRPSWQAWDTASPSVSLIEVLYRFHQNNDASISEVAHTSPPIPPLRSPASNQEGNHGTSTTYSRMYLRDDFCGSGDHPSDHDAQFGCAELVTDLPSSTFAFVLR